MTAKAKRQLAGLCIKTRNLCENNCQSGKLDCGTAVFQIASHKNVENLTNCSKRVKSGGTVDHFHSKTAYLMTH